VDKAVIPELNSRVLVLKPGLEAVNRAAALLRPAALRVEECPLRRLPLELEQGAGAVVIDELVFSSPLADADALDALERQVEAKAETRPIPIVLLRSSNAQFPERLKTLQTFCVLDEPVESVTLVSVVRAALRVSESQRQLAAYETELSAAASELRAAEARKDAWLAARGHEFRNPLASIVAGLELIRISADYQRPGMLRAVDIVERQVHQLTDLVDHMLDTTRTTTAAASPPDMPAAPGAGAINLPPRRTDFPTRRVLIVDDNIDAAESLGALLTALGAVVCVAHSGDEALRELERFHPDSAIVDVGMPGMDGYELARRLRASRGFNRNLIVALTGWGEPQDREKSKAAGIDHHLVKPPDVGTLRSVLDRRRVERVSN
jgi:CheY-like chemotaxis protein